MADETKSILDQLKDDSILGNVDDIIDQLRSDDTIEDEPSAPPLNINEADIGKFIIEQSGKLVQDGTALVSRLKKTVGASGDAEEVSALADLITSTSTAIEALNKIYTQNKKIQAAKELKQAEIEGRKEIAKLKSEGENKPGLIVANREEIFALLLAGKKPDNVIEMNAEIDAEFGTEDEKAIGFEDSDKLGPA